MFDDTTLDNTTLDSATFNSPTLGQDRRTRLDRPRASAFVDDESLEPGPLAVAPEGNRHWLYRTLKRALDVLGTLVLLLILSPVMIVSFLLLVLTTKGRPIFVQERVGQCGRLFRMYKFRTMCLDAHAKQQEIANEMGGPVFKNRSDPRITRLGRILRRWSIDETPQLFNVLLGDMTLVGPRPPIMSEVVRYEPWQRRRLSVTPGLTCLWQVSGRNEIGFDDWMRMDLWYVENQTLLTDLKLLVRTPLSVLSRRGAF
jgi:lipopolysaccharide/colanic/teichoic acid biosynthesis glycosyltransferase